MIEQPPGSCGVIDDTLGVGFDLDKLNAYSKVVGPSTEELERHQPTGRLWRW